MKQLSNNGNYHMKTDAVLTFINFFVYKWSPPTKNGQAQLNSHRIVFSNKIDITKHDFS